MGDRLGQKLNDLKHKIDRPKQKIIAKRRRKELVRPAAQTLDLDVVVQADQQH